MPASETHFLIVDDFAPMRRIVAGLLKELGYSRQTEADDGASAWKILESGTSNVEFVVTDWNMPVMDGIELLRKIRANPAMRHLPVLIVTAETRKENIMLAAQCGADGYIVKPFNTGTLERKIRHIMGRRTPLLSAA
ncbi:response regulator [Herbaspirillum sp. alder98]|uniref:response regulator n=1 Tax=Herbaspirillum sp. alder98 TaxID=2913096 RepID=UPI001CD89545|nr:response regulator [Herbaspirillum sp. alder98]MCA1326116.1 response regulator [Herbaspirillum sp. alder98]